VSVGIAVGTPLHKYRASKVSSFAKL